MRFKSINSLSGSDLYEYEMGSDRKSFDSSLADKRYFVPIREAVKSVPVGSVNSSEFYDFPDGKDNGMSLPASRTKGIDIAELSSDIRKNQDKAKKAVDDYNDYKETRNIIDSRKSSKKMATTGSNQS